MCKEEYAKAIDKAVFPGMQGGPLEHGYLELVKAISQAYAQEGYKRGDNAVKDMLKIFCERKLITKDKDGYHYHPALLPLK